MMDWAYLMDSLSWSFIGFCAGATSVLIASDAIGHHQRGRRHRRDDHS